MATDKKRSSAQKNKKEQMQEMEKAENFQREVILWIMIAVSLLLFISNFGIGGAIGNAVSNFIFGIFGLFAYLFPIVLLVSCFFYVSNKGNHIATVKLVAVCLLTVFLCTFMSLVVSKKDSVATPIEAFVYAQSNRIGGGLIGNAVAYPLMKGFSSAGAYIIDIIALIIAVVLLTGKSAIKGMQTSGRKVYESAKEKNERYQEYKEYKDQERELEKEIEKETEKEPKKEMRRSDHVVVGVSTNTKLEKKKTKPKETDEMNEIDIREFLDTPDVQEEKKVSLISEALNREADMTIGEEKAEEIPSVIPMVSGNFSRDTTHIPTVEPQTWEQPEHFPAEEEELFIDPAIADPVPIEEPPVAEKKQEVTKTSPEELKKEVQQVAQVVEEIEPVKNYVFPPISLLKPSSRKTSGNTQTQLRETAAKLQQTLKTFGVNVTVTDISCGPAVTRFEIQPEMGVKVSKIVGLADDIKLNLAAADIRIEAPIPGKAAVGIEVPNKENVTVAFRDLVESNEFKNSQSPITFAVGKDIAGKVKVTDIAKMPHLLIAGATGSGKSVCINTIIMSILYKADPNEVKLIMIDPKVVELSVYNGIPHLMIPVVTDPKKAAGALNWAVAEMTERYEKFAECHVRDLNGYNAKIDSIQVPEGQPRPQKLPKIVIIVDELADLMMVASNEVEEAICRLAQLARACGIHLIIATQRPSVNVITGLIKANMPSRIAFAVTSGVDSRTILDMVGAEKLLGKGDMLFYPQGIPKPLRVQGAFVSDTEVSDVVEFLAANNGAVEYNQDIQQKVEHMEQSSSQSVSISDNDPAGDGKDSYFNEAARIIVDKEKASIGMLQRYLKVGFNRAARIMDQLEEAGIVGPEEGTKPRKVLMSPEEFEQFIDEN